MGYRIELSEIEQALVSIPGVRDAGVILVESATDSIVELVAYVDIDEKAALSDIVADLRSKLPPYMIPKKVFTMQRVPRASSGKIDRQALLARYRGQ